jgi:hypothetical protein
MKTLLISAVAIFAAAGLVQAEPLKLSDAQLAQTAAGANVNVTLPSVNINTQQNIGVAGQGGAAVAVSVGGNAFALLTQVSVIRQHNN